MNKSESIGELAKALAKAQAQMTTAKRDKEVDFTAENKRRTKYDYADLAACWEVCRKPLSDNGLSVAQPTYIAEGTGSTIVETILMHSSGEWISSETYVRAADTRPQAVGSAITYARRYGLCAMVGIVTDDDDDGQAAQNQQQSQAYAAAAAKAAEQLKKKSQGQDKQSMAGQVFSILQEAGIAKTEYKQYLSEVLGREVASSSDLTKEDVATLVQHTQNMKEQGEK